MGQFLKNSNSGKVNHREPCGIMFCGHSPKDHIALEQETNVKKIAAIISMFALLTFACRLFTPASNPGSQPAYATDTFPPPEIFTHILIITLNCTIQSTLHPLKLATGH